MNCSYCQVTQQQIRIGDTIPNESYDIINYKKSKINLTELKGKLIILDFWSTGCSSCIEAMPKMDFLQKKFGDQLLILPVIAYPKVTSSELEIVKKFWASNKYTNRTSLPSIVVDTGNISLRTIFRIWGVPYEVWINKGGKVVALTDAEYVNEDEIEKVLAGYIPDWDPLPNGEVRRFMDREFEKNSFSLFSIINKFDSSIINSSKYFVLSPFLSQYRIQSYWYDSSKWAKRIYYLNASIGGMYRLTAQCFLNKNLPIEPISVKFLNYDSSIMEDALYRDTSVFKYRNDWDRANRFSYERVEYPEISSDELRDIILADLDRRFKAKSIILKRNITILGLSKIEKVNNLYSKDSTDEYLNIFDLGDVLKLAISKKVNIDQLMISKKDESNDSIFPAAILKEIEKWSSSTKKFRVLNKLLAKYGLELTKGELMVDQLIVDFKNRIN